MGGYSGPPVPSHDSRISDQPIPTDDHDLYGRAQLQLGQKTAASKTLPCCRRQERRRSRSDSIAFLYASIHSARRASTGEMRRARRTGSRLTTAAISSIRTMFAAKAGKSSEKFG